MRARVAVVSWNTRELLAACLASLEADRRSGLAEVVVIDNGSSDGSPQLVSSEFGWATLIEAGGNLGFGAAANRALAGAETEWVVPANADVRLEPGALEILLAAADAEPRAAALAPRLILPDGTTQHSVHRFPGPWIALASNLSAQRLSERLGDALLLEGCWDPDRRRPVGWAHGALLAVRRESFERIRGFDERQWMYAEDIDLGWRLRKTGRLTLYVPEAHVHHEQSAAARIAFSDEREARHLAASYRWIERRRGRLAAAASAAISIAVPRTLAALAAPAAAAGSKRARRMRGRRRGYAELHRVARSQAREGESVPGPGTAAVG